MTAPAHWRVLWGGAMPNGERWQNSFAIRPSDTGIGVSSWTDLVADVVGDLETFANAVEAFWATGTTWDFARVAEIDATGHYAAVHDGIIPTTWTNPSHPQSLPNQCSCVVTLYTATAGRRGRGRFYLPFTTSLDTGTGKISDSNVATIANAAKTLVDNINNWPGLDIGDTVMCVASNAGSALHDVTRIGVGNVVDTQRRRRGSEVEARTKMDI